MDIYGINRQTRFKCIASREQKEAIIRYAERHSLNIIEWFEERETAAKQGRPLFNKMMKLLKERKAKGVIFHKLIVVLVITETGIY
ncbi:MAG: recombinase family protein [Bacteroidetes bacterium]|nr:recombinase family protein [Bacteroidota bacterium]